MVREFFEENVEGTLVRKRVEDPNLYKIDENEVFDLDTGEVKKVQRVTAIIDSRIVFAFF